MWPWRAVKVGHFEFSGSFFQCLGTNSSQGFCSFCFNWSVQSDDGAEQTVCYLRLYVKGRGRGIPSKLVLWSFFPMFVNKLLPGNLSVLLQNQSVHTKDGAEQTMCFLRLYVEGRGRGVPSKLVLWSLFPKFVNKLPPGNLSVLL